MKTLTLLLSCSLLVSCSSHAADACLVGTWKARGNGAAEWMARHVPGMHLHMGVREGVLRFAVDGRYTSEVRLDARASMEHGGSAATHGPMSVRTSGHWRTQGDRLTLEPQSQRSQGSIDSIAATGRRARRPLPVAGTRAMRMSYTCRGDTLVTGKTFPGIADPMTQRYVRVHG